MSLNPAAKEFFPAHVLKKRQEEAQVDSLSHQLSQVGLESQKKDVLSKDSHKAEKINSSDKTEAAATAPAASSSDPSASQSSKSSSNSQTKTNDKRTTDSSAERNAGSDSEQPTTTNNNSSNNNNNNNIGDNDRSYLQAGENLCEFNGEQFIVPGDDEDEREFYESSVNAGYDFGNAEDNQDEDICNAFEEFLETLPD